MTNGEALTAAKREMRDRHPDNPSVWFAFVLIGHMD